MELFERIKHLIATCSGGNQSAFVREIDESISTFNGYMTVGGQSRIKVKTLAQILVKFGINANWLLLGEGPMLRSEASPAVADPISQRVEQVARTMRESGVDELKILAAARDVLEGEITKLRRARGEYGFGEPAAGMPRAAEPSAEYGAMDKAAGDDSV